MKSLFKGSSDNVAFRTRSNAAAHFHTPNYNGQLLEEQDQNILSDWYSSKYVVAIGEKAKEAQFERLEHAAAFDVSRR